MKRVKVLWLLIPVVLFGALWRVNVYRHSAPVILAKYPQLRGRVAELVAPEPVDGWMSRRSDGKVLLRVHMTFDNSNASTHTVYWLSETGDISLRHFTNGAIDVTRDWRLTTARMQIVKKALRRLPPGEYAPRFGDLLVLSFDNDGQWTTRVYIQKNRLLDSVEFILTSCMTFDY